MKGILQALALDLKARGALDVREAFIDGSFAPAKKGAPKSEKQSAVRELRLWQWPIAMVFPVSVCIESATPHEVIKRGTAQGLVNAYATFTNSQSGLAPVLGVSEPGPGRFSVVASTVLDQNFTVSYLASPKSSSYRAGRSTP